MEIQHPLTGFHVRLARLFVGENYYQLSPRDHIIIKELMQAQPGLLYTNRDGMILEDHILEAFE